MLQTRFILWIMLFLAITCNIFLMNNLNIAIVSMVKYRNTTSNAQSNVCNHTTDTTHKNETATIKDHHLDGELEWDKNEQNLVLGAFYLFPWISQFFGGIFSHKYGTKVVVGISTLIGCVLSSLIPPLSYMDPKLVMVVRALQGLIGSVAFPAGLYAIIGQWCPPHERGKFITVFLGTSFGIAIGYPLFGFISETIGWQYVFHLTSLLGILWYIGWQYLVYDTPDKHPRITQKEKTYIKTSLGKSRTKEKLPVPWKAILTSMPFIVNVICQFGVIWGRFTLNIYVPTYFKVVHGLSSKENGLVSGIPFFLKSVLSYMSGVISDILLKRNWMSRNGVRNASTFVSSVLCGFMLIGVSYSDCNSTMATIYMSLCVILNACFMTGSSVGLVDMSPNFCSILQGVCGTVGMISGFLSPMLVSFLSHLYADDPLEQWKVIWLVTGAIYAIPGMIFVLFSDSELQPWNAPPETKDQELLTKKDNDK